MDNTIDRRLLLGAAGLAGVAALSSVGRAGPLNPPGGPVGSTGKTIVETEPRTAISATSTPGNATNLFVITQPGSYYLTGNVSVPSGRSFLAIQASGVSVDLCGFVISGEAGSVNGIHAIGIRDNIAVRNGTVTGMGGAGISVTISTNGQVFKDLLVSDCGGSGIAAADFATIESCTCNNNGTHGIFAGGASVVRGCSTSDNGQSGISVTTTCVVESCTARDNGENGIETGTGCVVRGCATFSNTGYGVFAGVNNLIESNTANSNGASGISATTGSTVRFNTANLNGSVDTSGAGVRVSNLCRVEGNQCNSNYRGLWATSTFNLITRNTCSTSTGENFFIVANNRYGPVIDLTAAGPVGVAGDAAAGTLTSSDSNANYAL